jgi:hypothetical protein
MPRAGPIVMFPPPALVFTVAEKEADGVGAAVDPGAAGAVADPAAPEPGDDPAVDDTAAPGDREGPVPDCWRADELRLDEQPTTATAAKTAQAAVILTLVGRAMSRAGARGYRPDAGQQRSCDAAADAARARRQ